MNRAMFSGVAGMKSHQTKMDVIGNNIANVNTYGYKAQRAVFSDIYYQNLRSASGGNANKGGTNPSSIGYGSSLAAIQAQMTQSSVQNTGFGLDVAITGEGFLQVMDPDGNIFYTKAGMLDYDANGYLTDINGNFVLGGASADGKPGTSKIKLDNVGSVEAKTPSVEVPINGVNYKLTTSNASKYGNVNVSFASSETMPAGLKAEATISTTGSVNVVFNAYENFANMAEVNQVINDAITAANGGKQHAAGTFTLTADKNAFGTDATAGSWTGKLQGDPATVVGNGLFDGAFNVKDATLGKVLGIGADIPGTVEITCSTGNPLPAQPYTMKVTIDSVVYEGIFAGNLAKDATVELKQTTPANGTGKITMSVADKDKLTAACTAAGLTPGVAVSSTQQIKATPPKFFMGGVTLASVSPNFKGQGAMTFVAGALGAVPPGVVPAPTIAADEFWVTATTANGLTFEGKAKIGGGGTFDLSTTNADPALVQKMTFNMPDKTKMMDQLGLDSKATPVPTDAQIHTEMLKTVGFTTMNMKPATDAATTTLTGAELVGGSFGITSGKLTGTALNNLFGGAMTFQKTSNDFKGSGVVDSLDAKYVTGPDGQPMWRVTMKVGGVDYTAEIDKASKASSILLKSRDGDSIQMSNPKFDGMTAAFEKTYPGKTPVADDPISGVGVMEGLLGGETLSFTPAIPSKEMGLGTQPFTLTGGTEGGVITLDELSNIAIGQDGTVTVSHPDKGAVVAGKISLANFANASGLQLNGENYYSATANSGDPKLCDPGSDGSGALKSSALEMSNVDLSSEFADMITTQRGFQANSRIITVSDTMMEELINLKR